ncbi:MAG: phosphoribosylglycinamide formyltransferase [Rhodocyclaceae bacterium]|nr:phosphoribosylglycinamide formyltransferase [Rhodocyclaceae bacterium]
MKSIIVLISGRGSNLGAILRAGLQAQVAAVISNRPDAAGLALARAADIATAVLDHREFDSREAFDAALAERIDTHVPALVVLAGFMRVLTAGFVDRYRGRMINIHPSLLPAFTGLDTHRRALDAGVRIHGCTVHFVTSDLDGGPIIAQAAVPVLPGDDEAALAARVLEQEHRLYPQAIRWFLEGRLTLAPNGRAQLAGAAEGAQSLINPLPDPAGV